jgi:hypothetical protein
MTSYRSLLLLLVVVIATSVASAIHAEGLQEASLDVRSLQGVEEEVRRDDMHLHCHAIPLQGLLVFIRLQANSSSHLCRSLHRSSILCYALRNNRLFYSTACSTARLATKS